MFCSDNLTGIIGSDNSGDALLLSGREAGIHVSRKQKVHTINESLATLHIQRQHKLDKDNRFTYYIFFCSLAMDKTMFFNMAIG